MLIKLATKDYDVNKNDVKFEGRTFSSVKSGDDQKLPVMISNHPDVTILGLNWFDASDYELQINENTNVGTIGQKEKELEQRLYSKYRG